jgi:hypothetical protein
MWPGSSGRKTPMNSCAETDASYGLCKTRNNLRALLKMRARYTRKKRGGGEEALPTNFVTKEIIENQIFRQTITFRISELERKLKIVVKHLRELAPKDGLAAYELYGMGGKRSQTRRKRAHKK